MTLLRRGLRQVMPALLTILVLGALLPIGVSSTIGGAFALGLAVLMTLLVAIGIERTVVTLLVIGFTLAPMNDVRPVESLTFVTASDVFLFVSVVMLIPILLGRSFDRQFLFLLGASGLVAVGLLSSALADSPPLSLNSLVRLLVGALAMPIVFMLWRPDRRVVVLLAGSYVLGNVISVAQAMLSGVRSSEGRYIGLTQHPNILGLCALLGLALTPFLYWELSQKYRWVVVGAAAVNAYGVWISGSRAALVVMVAIVGLYLLLSRSVPHGIALFGLSIGPLYIVGKAFSGSGQENNVLGRLQGGGSATLSDIAREQLAREATEKFTSHPLFGVGFGGVLEAHNLYLQVAAAVGVCGLIFYLVIIAAVIRQPFVLGRRYHLLALPAMSYALIAPLTPLLWDRYIWTVLALPFLVRRPPGVEEPAVDRHREIQNVT